LFDDIVAPDTASGGGYRPLRITVRPKGVEPRPETASSGEAAVAPRGMIAPAAPRQILAEASEQGVPIPRASPRPPAKPPDKAAAQSDRMSEARESGPFDSATAPLVVLPDGSFSITDWSRYCAGLPKSNGPFTLVKGSEYAAARRTADRANRAMHRADPGCRTCIFMKFSR